MKWFVSILVIVVLFIPAGCFLDSGDEGYDVSGNVTIDDDDGEPVYGVQIRLGTMVALTNTDGYFKFKDVSYGRYYIEADPYNNTIYDFKPTGYMVTIDEDTKINFIASR